MVCIKGDDIVLPPGLFFKLIERDIGRRACAHRIVLGTAPRPLDVIGLKFVQAMHERPQVQGVALQADLAGLVPRVPVQLVQIPAKQNSGRSSARANQVGVFRGLVSSHSQNDVAGTRQRLAGPSQRRQCGLAVLRIFVTAVVPN